MVRVAVGPPRVQQLGSEGQGGLRVFSAWDGLEMVDPDHEQHTGYVIRSADGLVRRIRNRCGSFGQDPVTVSLPTGSYTVEARAANFGLVCVPVLIQARQITIVYLDGNARPKGAGLAGEDFVKLPNGQLVGLRSHSERE